jgi:hypothetical protein
MSNSKRKRDTQEKRGTTKKKTKTEVKPPPPTRQLLQILVAQSYLIPDVWRVVRDYVYYHAFSNVKTLKLVASSVFPNMSGLHITQKGTVFLLSEPQRGAAQSLSLDAFCNLLTTLHWQQLPLFHCKRARQKQIIDVFGEVNDPFEWVCVHDKSANQLIKISQNQQNLQKHLKPVTAKVEDGVSLMLYVQDRWLLMDKSKDLFPNAVGDYHAKHSRVGYRMTDLSLTCKKSKFSFPILFSPDTIDWELCSSRVSQLVISQANNRDPSICELGFRKFKSGKEAALIQVVSPTGAQRMRFYSNGYYVDTRPEFDSKTTLLLQLEAPGGEIVDLELTLPDISPTSIAITDLVEHIIVYPQRQQILVILSQLDYDFYLFAPN